MSPQPINPSDEKLYKSSSDFSAILDIFKYGRHLYPQLIFGIAIIFLSSGFMMLSARLLGYLAEMLIKGVDTSNHYLWILAGSILMLEGSFVFATWFGRVRIAKVTNQISLLIRTALFKKVTNIPVAWFDQHPLGRTITRLTTDVEGVENFFNGTLTRVLSATITLISVMFAMILTDAKLGILITLSSLPAILFTIGMRRPIRHWLRVYKSRSSQINATLAEFINGFQVVKVFGLEKWTQNRFNGEAKELREAGFKMMNINSFVRPFVTLLCSMPLLIILWWGGHLVLTDSLTIGVLISFIRYAERILNPVLSLSHEVHVIQDAIASSERIKLMLIETEETKAFGNAGTISSQIVGDIQFNNVWMEYKLNTPILKGISFRAKPGMKIGLVGETGSGKSTTANLIPQLYKKSSGSIKIDGHTIETWNRESIREQIGIVSQDVIIFRGTLRDNLSISVIDKHGVTDEKILNACKQTGLISIMKQLDIDLNFHILDGGENLSMGERQLISFTRMILRDPAVLILDEATANIDETFEELIQIAIKKIMRNRTCFIIGHRLNTIKQCDNILVFSHGKIIEQGNHEELMANEKHYYQLATKQIAAEEFTYGAKRAPLKPNADEAHI
mgnify:CR=1 FL=1